MTYYSRVIFVHMEKCAGQSINRWLREELGDHFVTPNLVGDHREFIREYGGAYSIISGHIEFDGTGFDSRYKYITLLREPVERLLSWIYFILSINAETEYLQELKDGAKRFIDSEAKESNATFIKSITNPYCRRLARVSTLCELNDDMLAGIAIDVLRRFSCVGKFGDFFSFQENVASILGFTVTKQFPKENVTGHDKKRTQHSNSFLELCASYVGADLQLFNSLKENKTTFMEEEEVPFQCQNVTRYIWSKPTHPITAYWSSSWFSMFLAASLTSMVGHVEGFGRQSDGAFGFLTLGPYISLDAGSYEIYLSGEWITTGMVCLVEVFDVYSEEVINAQYLSDWTAKESLFTTILPLSLSKPCRNIEVKVLVPALHHLRIDHVTIAKHNHRTKEGRGEASYYPLAIERDISVVGDSLVNGVITINKKGVCCVFMIPLEFLDNSSDADMGKDIWLHLIGSVGPAGLAGAKIVAENSAGNIYVYPMVLSGQGCAHEEVCKPILLNVSKADQLRLQISVTARSELFISAAFLSRGEPG